MATWTPVRYARNGDVSIAYTVGGGGPVDLLFVGGFVSHLEIMLELPLAQRFWDRLCSFARVICFDKRGMGLSDRDAGAYTLENIAQDALAVLDAVGVQQAAVFGSPSAVRRRPCWRQRIRSASARWSSTARMRACRAHPTIRRGIPVETMRWRWARMSDSWRDPASVDAWAPSMLSDPELRAWWARLLRSGASPGGARAVSAMYEEVDVRPLLPTVQAPTLVLYRAEDRLVPPALSRTVARGISGAYEVELPGQDHLFLPVTRLRC